MKGFWIKIIFLLIWTIGLLTAGLLLPPTALTKKSFLFAQLDKNKLLQNTPAPRIILIGGSNLSFGIDSKMIRDSLHINPINTAIVAQLGLKYMLQNTAQYIRPNDIVVVCPEYQQYYGRMADGEAELLSMVFDVSPETRKLLDARQWLTQLKYIAPYAASKLNPVTRLNLVDTSVIDLYDRKSFNAFGDTYVHWTMAKQAVSSYTIDGDFNEDAFAQLLKFRDLMKQRKAKLFVSFPCYQDISFDSGISQIKTIAHRLNQNHFNLLGSPERYRFADSLVFNTPYHLIRNGVILRTRLLIGDLKKSLSPI